MGDLPRTPPINILTLEILQRLRFLYRSRSFALYDK